MASFEPRPVPPSVGLLLTVPDDSGGAWLGLGLVPAIRDGEKTQQKAVLVVPAGARTGKGHSREGVVHFASALLLVAGLDQILSELALQSVVKNLLEELVELVLLPHFVDSSQVVHIESVHDHVDNLVPLC